MIMNALLEKKILIFELLSRAHWDNSASCLSETERNLVHARLLND
jgi:hypothetical protein